MIAALTPAYAGADTTSAAIIVTVLLVILLVQREMLRWSTGHRATAVVRALDIAIIPMLLVFTLTMYLRLVAILGW